MGSVQLSFDIHANTIFLEKQLRKIEHLAQFKAKDMEKDYYDKYYPIYEEARKFLLTQRILLYGGLAINELMPKDLRFYEETELPDFDMMAVNGKKVAIKAVSYFKKKGYPFTTMSEALHENTYKVMVSGLAVLDITSVSKDLYKKLEKGSIKTSYDLWTVNTQFLRMSLHTLLSQPMDIHRWSKVFQRVLAFYQVYPPANTCSWSAQIPSQDPAKILDKELHKKFIKKALPWIKKNKYILFSPDGWLQYLPKQNVYVKQLNMLFSSYDSYPTEILVDEDNLEKVAEDLYEYIYDKLTKDEKKLMGKLRITKVRDNGILPPHIYIYLGNTALVGIYQTAACLSYNVIDNSTLRVASIQTILRMYLQILLSSNEMLNMDRIECMANLLTFLSLQNMMKTRNPLLKSFVLTCYGNQPGMATLKRLRYLRNKRA